MAHLWHILDKQWHPREIRPGPLDSAASVRLCAGVQDTWVLIASPSAWVRVNGQPIALGIRSLRHRDDIRIGSLHFFYSTETLARIESFPGADGVVMCPRCRKEIVKDTPAVRCPGCQTWHHQSEVFGCWLYSTKCALCDTETALDAGLRWQPEF